MLLPNSGMSVTMNAVDIKNWSWRSILTGIIRRKRIKEICGIDSFRPRQRRRPASSWIKPGNHFMFLKRLVESKEIGHKANQKFHGLPYNKLYIMLEYKLKLYGIPLIKQEESYTSRCSPFSPEVSKRYAEASNRKERGMYITDGVRYNADAVGAFNILRKYLSVSGKQKELSVTGLKNPEIIKVAA